MNIALWILGVLTVGIGIGLACWYPSVTRGGDNFAIGFAWMGLLGIAGLCGAIWLVLFSIHNFGPGT